MPKVSVIIPTYNRGDFLKSSVNSVLKQTYEDYELIISDDASTDHTRKYVESISDSRVVYICNKTNRGVAATRNSALKISRGDYIAFLDDDDEWLPEKLSLQVEKIEKSSPDVGGVYTGVSYLDIELGEITSVSNPHIRGNILNDILPENFLVTSSLLLRKSCFEKAGLFDERFQFGEDFDMWIRIANYYNFDFIKEPLVKYAIHESKITLNYQKVISGLELLLSKHKDLYSQNKKAYSDYTLGLGIFYCYNGNTTMGRMSFIEAIKLNPANIKHYYNFALSLLGARAFMKIKIHRSGLSQALRSLTYG